MKYVFFGTPRFAEIVLSELLEADLVPTALVCNPDRPMGRKKIVTAPLTKQLLIDRKLSVAILQPEKLDEEFIQQLKDLDPDFFVVAAYAKIIPDAALSLARLGVLGTHPSLLPLYRGASPIQSVILAGESQTGATIYQMDAKMDHGAIFAQESIPLQALETSYLNLEGQLAKLSGKLLVDMIPQLLAQTADAKIQDELLATFTKKFKTEDGFVESALLEAGKNGDAHKAELIVRIINALNPEPGAWTIENNKRVKLLEARIVDGSLKLSKIQIEGEKSKSI
jgi:methionyl-tRNA formyltransferase